jgi:hypothetical protein
VLSIDAAAYPLLKQVLVSLAAIPACFLLGNPVRKMPGTERVL